MPCAFFLSFPTLLIFCEQITLTKCSCLDTYHFHVPNEIEKYLRLRFGSCAAVLLMFSLVLEWDSVPLLVQGRGDEGKKKEVNWFVL